MIFFCLSLIQSSVVRGDSLLNLIELGSKDFDQLLYALAATLLHVFTGLRSVTDVTFRNAVVRDFELHVRTEKLSFIDNLEVLHDLLDHDRHWLNNFFEHFR